MIEQPTLSVGDVNDMYNFPSAQPRTLVISNAAIAAALVTLSRTDTAITADNCDLSIPAGATMILDSISVQTISTALASTIGVFRYSKNR